MGKIAEKAGRNYRGGVYKRKNSDSQTEPEFCSPENLLMQTDSLSYTAVLPAGCS